MLIIRQHSVCRKEMVHSIVYEWTNHLKDSEQILYLMLNTTVTDMMYNLYTYMYKLAFTTQNMYSTNTMFIFFIEDC